MPRRIQQNMRRFRENESEKYAGTVFASYISEEWSVFWPRMACGTLSRTNIEKGGMMKLLIDGKQSKSTLEDERNLESAIGTLNNLTGSTNRIIKSIAIDGVVLSPQTEKQLMKKKVSAIKKLQVVTDTPLHLAIKVLLNAEDYLKKSEAQIKRFAVSLQSGGTGKDYDAFADNLKGWVTVVQLLDIVRDYMGLDLKKVKVKGQPVSQIVGELEKTLSRINKALQGKDMVFLQDLLRYELMANAGKLRLVIQKILECARKREKAER
jgi:hypothetical protein